MVVKVSRPLICVKLHTLLHIDIKAVNLTPRFLINWQYDKNGIKLL